MQLKLLNGLSLVEVLMTMITKKIRIDIQNKAHGIIFVGYKMGTGSRNSIVSHIYVDTAEHIDNIHNPLNNFIRYMFFFREDRFEECQLNQSWNNL